MECAQSNWPSNKEYLQQFNNKVVKQRIPLHATIELTHRCNLRCVHCYLGDQKRVREKSSEELNTSQWISIIDEITDAGCLNLLLTGGDPLIRPDFDIIYRHARMKGLLVTVFTNGTLITDRIVRLFEEYTPAAVEISLYGATAVTYEKITGIKGSYDKCLKGIQTLVDHGIHFKLKTILMTYNSHELSKIEEMAKDYGSKFRFDSEIFPCFNGNKSPIDLRVSPEEAIEKEFADNDTIEEWIKYSDRSKDIPPSNKLYQCGAGQTGFSIDPYGILTACLMVTQYSYNLTEGDFQTGWNGAVFDIKKEEAGLNYICNRCEKRFVCNACPAVLELESDTAADGSGYHCSLAQLRFDVINN